MAAQQGPQLNPSSLRPAPADPGGGPRRPPWKVVVLIALAALAVAATVGVALRVKDAVRGDDEDRSFPGVEDEAGGGSERDGGSLYQQANLRRALERAEERLGSRGRVLSLRLSAGDLQVTGADSADPRQPHHVLVKSDGEVRDILLQTITGILFPLEAVRTAAPQRIAAALRERGRGRGVDYMVFSAGPADGRREWVAFQGGRGYRAEADGSDLRRLGEPGRRERATELQRRRQLRRRTQCIRRAARSGNPAAAAQRCLR